MKIATFITILFLTSLTTFGQVSGKIIDLEFIQLPENWHEANFTHLDKKGVFLVSANKDAGQVDAIKIVAEKGGKTRLKLPFKTHFFQTRKGVTVQLLENNMLELTFKKGGELVVRNGYE